MEGIAGRAKKIISPTEPFGLMCLASYLEKFGKEVNVLDVYALGLGFKEVLAEIENYSPDIIGFSLLTSQANITMELTKFIRAHYTAKNYKVVYGNIHADIYYEYFLKHGYADIVVHGEGEDTLLQLVDNLENDKSLETIRGISFLKPDGEVFKTEDRGLIEDLDKIPLPARHLVPMHLYKMSYYWGPNASNPKTFKTIFTSRGCPYRCTFCNVHKERRIRYFSVKRVEEEIRLVLNQYKAKYVFFLDSCFMVSRDRVVTICEMMLRNKFKFDWACEGRVNLASKDPELLRLMKKAGCIQICYGIESGVQKLLDNVRKDCTIEQIEAAVSNTIAAGIRTIGLFILGLPGETPELTEQTIAFSLKFPFEFAQYGILTPYPGTQIYYDLLKENKIDHYEWDRYTQYAAFTNKEPIYTPEGYPPYVLLEKQKEAIMRCFFRPRVMIRQILNIRPHNLGQLLGASASLWGWMMEKISKRINRN
jgi:magnesium-protoporphyrin IX monomethyl ester (oxidative) cyclase